MQQLLFLGSLWAGASLLSIMVVALLWSGWIKPQALAETRAQRLEVVRLLARAADLHVMDKLDGLGSIAKGLGQKWPGLPRRELQRELDQLRDILQLETLFVATQEGRPLAFSPTRGPDGTSNMERRYDDRQYFRETVRTQRVAISGIIYGRAAQEMVVAAALPIVSGGRRVAYLVGSISLETSAQAIEQAAGHPTAWFALVDRDRQAVYIDPKTRELSVQDWGSHPVASLLGDAEAAGFVEIEGQESLVTQAAIPALGMNLALIGTVRALLIAQQKLLRVIVVAILVSVAVSLLVSTVLGLRFLRERKQE